MFKCIRSLTTLFLVFEIATFTACQPTATEPGGGGGVESVGAAVNFNPGTVCQRLDTPNDSLNMGTVEFENTSSKVSIVPKQLTIRMTARTVVGTRVVQFNPSWRNSDNSATLNIYAHTDSIASYIQFGVLAPIPPGGKWRTTLKGSVPSPPTAGSYTFSIMSDSLRVRTVAGDSVKVTMRMSDFVLTTKASCP